MPRDTDFTAALAAPHRFATALYLGPGLEAVAGQLSGRHADRLVAFTLSGAQMARRAQADGAFSHVAFHPALLSVPGEDAALHDFNIKGHAALRPATGLRDVFPGLRATTQGRVETIAPQDALDKAALDDSGNLLILGATGFEMEVLDAVLDTEGQRRFARIILMLPGMALYAGASDGQALADRLEAASYRRVWTDASDPDMPVVAFDLDAASLADRSEIATLNTRLEEMATALEEARAEGEAAQRRASEAAAARNALGRKLEAAEARMDELSAALDTARRERDSAVQELSEIKSAAAQDGQARPSEQDRIADLSEQLNAREAEVATLTGRLDALAAAQEKARAAQQAAEAARNVAQADAETQSTALRAARDARDTLRRTLDATEARKDQLKAALDAVRKDQDKDSPDEMAARLKAFDRIMAQLETERAAQERLRTLRNAELDRLDAQLVLFRSLLFAEAP